MGEETGVDITYVYESDDGWKISKYLEKECDFDFENENHIKLLSKTLHQLHDSHVQSKFEIDFYKETESVLEAIKTLDSNLYKELSKLKVSVHAIDKKIRSDAWEKELCHNDVNKGNCILINDRINLIDWEYSGQSDVGYDLCKLISIEALSIDECYKYLAYYYHREPTKEELNHIVGCVIVSYYYWYVWACFLKLHGENMTDAINKYIRILDHYLELYQNIKE